MNLKKICLLFTILLHSSVVLGQKKAEADSLSIDNNGKKHLFVGVDLFAPALSFFSDKKGMNAYVSFRIKGRWTGVAEFGYEKNIYDDIGWNVEGKGFSIGAGVNYMITNMDTDNGEGFYIGGRLMYSPFIQTVRSYPLTSIDGDGKLQVIGYGSLPSANVGSGWAELLGGAKVQLGKTPFYLDIMVRPKVQLFSQKQDGIDNLVIPGYGKDRGAFQISFFWGVSYRIF
jgi:hypothetical protein